MLGKYSGTFENDKVSTYRRLTDGYPVRLVWTPKGAAEGQVIDGKTGLRIGGLFAQADGSWEFDDREVRYRLRLSEGERFAYIEGLYPKHRRGRGRGAGFSRWRA